MTACVCAFGQSASTILATLRTRGSTSTGGEAKYENYLPLLGPGGRLDYSFIPTNSIFTDVFDWVNENGSKRDQDELNNLSVLLNYKIDSSVVLATNTAATVANTVVSNLIVTLDEHESDPRFFEYISTNQVAIGKGAVADADNAYQIGTGTNTTSNTLKFMDTVVIDASGNIPSEIAPWAVNRNDLDSATNILTSGKVSRSGDSMSGDLDILPTYLRAMSLSSNTNSVYLDGILTFSSLNDRDAEFTGNYKVGLDTGRAELVFTYASNNVYRGSFSAGETTVTVDMNVGSSPGVTYSVGGSVLYSAPGTFEQAAGVSRMAERVYRHVNAKNPSGLTLADMNTPVMSVDLISPSENVFRLSITDDGDLIISKIK